MAARLLRPVARRWWLPAAALTGATAMLYMHIRRVDGLQPTHRADCIIVLGAGVRNRGPGRCYRPRLNHAISLYQRGFADRIIVTELTPAAEVACVHLITHGIPAKAIVIENRSRDTWQNLLLSREIMRGRGWQSAIVVTCPFHVFRSRAMARDLGMSVQMAAAPDSPTEQDAWRHVKYTLRECLSYPKYRVLGP
ncbi:MAG: YdcF family protein [Armatimonadota bacterium]|nr:YdcF family protein [Armatimonadota bacterium]